MRWTRGTLRGLWRGLKGIGRGGFEGGQDRKQGVNHRNHFRLCCYVHLAQESRFLFTEFLAGSHLMFPLLIRVVPGF